MFRGTKKLWAGAAAAAMTFAGVAPLWAANGTWQGPSSDNDWDTTTNWVGGTIADGANFTANFTGPDLTTGGNLVTMNVAPHTIGNVVFSDSNLGTGALGDNWDIQGANALTLANTTTPTITVNALPTGSYAVLNVPVAGTQGFIKAGVGELRLGTLGGAHTITGGINVNGGTLYYETGGTVPVQPITIRNGATLSVPGSIGTPTTGIINVPAATTGNITARNTGTTTIIAVGGGAGSALNVSAVNDGAIIAAQGSWATGGALGSLTVNGVATGINEVFRFHSNGGTAYTGNSLLNTALALNDIVAMTRTGSSGNTIDIGALSGNATAILSGGGSGIAGEVIPGNGTGSFANYSIGNLNTNTTFAGTIDTQSAIPQTNPANADNRGGLNLTKVGTGTLTLSGTLNYQPVVSTNASRRGGITTITGGTLKLTGSASLPAGIAGAMSTGTTPTLLGDLLTTVDIRTGATLDVSGVPGYSSSALQQTIGRGTIVGNYIHDEGILAPGDTLSGTTANTVAAANTLTFQNNLSFAGSGQIKFNVSPSTVSGNDLIQVNGATSLTGNPTLTLGLIGGITTGNYPIINSTGGFGGTNASGWTVGWTGRGSAPGLNIIGNQLVLSVTPSNFGNLTWSGAADGVTWDVNGQSNWHNTGTNAADKFFDNDSITFGDTFGPGNTPVVNSSITVNTTVSPLNMVFNSNTVAYSITGAGKISGGASLVKTGNTLLTLQTANDFTGTASISGTGGVDIGAFPTALGTNTLTLTNTKLTTQGGTISNSGIVLPASTSSEIATVGATTLVTPALSGDGNLLITNDSAGRRIDLGSTNAFTGDLTLGAPASANNLIVRLPGSSLASSLVTLNNASLRDRATSPQVQTLGALEGDATSSLWGYEGGSTSTGRTWRIGALNTSTTFNGLIQDSINAIADGTRSTNLHKIGTGTLTLTGGNTDPDLTPFPNAYTGRTAVEQGTLSISPAVPDATGYLADTADVLLFSGGILNLNFASDPMFPEIIDQLFVNGINVLPGVYGGIGSAAAPGFQLAQITGTGLLQVTTYRIPGDFNGVDGVNAADLDVWKTAAVATTPAGMAAGDTDGDGDADGNDFLIWQRYLGTPASTIAASAVPEPASALLAAGATLSLVGAARRRK
jgi:hypothetical protein